MSSSAELFIRAKQHIPGGVNSPVRAFNGVGGTPIFMASAKGAYLCDVEQKHYIDYIGSWGPMILGHNHPAVITAIHEMVDQCLSFGAPSLIEITVAEKISQLMPNLEMVRMVNSGTEATMTAIRLARGITGRDKIVKFAGCYHGHSDSLLVNAGSGALTLGVPSSPGVPKELAQHTLTVDYNDIAGVEAIFMHYGKDIAAVIVEPVAGNMNCVPATLPFLTAIREQCDAAGSLFIFDEVMTGFRVAKGGAQALYNIKPDLTTLGKVIGGGMPVGAIGGFKKWMEHLAPIGKVYQAGTLSGNPVAMAAGLATLTAIEEVGFFERLTQKTELLMLGLNECATANGIPLLTQHVGGMFGFFFTELKTIRNLQQVQQGDLARFKTFFHEMLQDGVYLAPSMYEAGFMSMAHGDEEIKLTVQAAERCFQRLAQKIKAL